MAFLDWHERIWLSDDGLLFILSRFDRTDDGTPLGFEDMAVLTGRSVERKYEGSYEMIAQAVEKYAGDGSVAQLKKLFERVVLSCYLRDGDAHLKNFGMLYEHPAASRRLAPVYDVVCTDVYPELDGTMALKMHKSKTFPNDAELIAYGNRLGLNSREVAEVLTRIEQAYQSVVARCKQDPRYQTDGLLVDIQQAVKRTGLRDKLAKKVR